MQTTISLNKPCERMLSRPALHLMRSGGDLEVDIGSQFGT